MKSTVRNVTVYRMLNEGTVTARRNGLVCFLPFVNTAIISKDGSGKVSGSGFIYDNLSSFPKIYSKCLRSCVFDGKQ